MNVRNCRRCKKLFNYMVGPIICPACREELEQEFQKVKKYIQEHTRCDIRTVSEACEVDAAQIRQWVREERLEFADDSAVGLNCERCGKMIKSGRFCQECKTDMTKTLNNAMALGRGTASGSAGSKSSNDATSPRMRFIDK